MKRLILCGLAIAFFAPVFAHARTQAYCPPVDVAEYKELVDTWYAEADIDGFSISEFSFCGDEGGDVLGKVSVSSNSLSTLGLTYTLTLSLTVNKNTDAIKLNSEIDTAKIAQRVKQFESKKEVKDFVERLGDILDKNVFLFEFRLKSGDYFLVYYENDDAFNRYSLPLSMSDDFPALANYKERAETAGCSVGKDEGVTYLKNEFWNEISVYAKVKGDCERSDTYGEQIYEIQYPIKNDWWTRIKVWFKKLTH